MASVIVSVIECQRFPNLREIIQRLRHYSKIPKVKPKPRDAAEKRPILLSRKHDANSFVPQLQNLLDKQKHEVVQLVQKEVLQKKLPVPTSRPPGHFTYEQKKNAVKKILFRSFKRVSNNSSANELKPQRKPLTTAVPVKSPPIKPPIMARKSPSRRKPQPGPERRKIVLVNRKAGRPKAKPTPVIVTNPKPTLVIFSPPTDLQNGFTPYFIANTPFNEKIFQNKTTTIKPKTVNTVKPEKRTTPKRAVNRIPAWFGDRIFNKDHSFPNTDQKPVMSKYFPNPSPPAPAQNSFPYRDHALASIILFCQSAMY